MDDDISYYSFIPVLGSDGSIVAVPYLGMSDDSQGIGDVNEVLDSSDSSIDSSLGDIQTSPQDIQITQDITSVDAFNALSVTSPPLSSPAPADIGTTAPDPLLFRGAVWISGTDSVLGDLTVYFPVDSKPNWGLDSSGYLVYLGNSSVTGFCTDVYNNALSASAFSYPRYRMSNSYDYQYLRLIPDNSNAPIATIDAPVLSMSDSLPFIAVAMLGVILLFTSKLLR